MSGLVVLLVITCVINSALGQLPPPGNLRAFTEHDGVLIRFDAVEGAVGYLGVLGAAEASSVESADPQLYFGDLVALTEYTVFVSAIDGDGNDGEPAFLVFTTGVGDITNFKVVTTSSSLMTLEWDPMDGVESYIIDPVEDTSMPPVKFEFMNDTDDTPSLPTVRMTGDASARLTGLKPMTYYKIAIRGLRDNDLGPTSTIRARTDGKGLILYNIWRDHNGIVLGGTGTIFKPLDHPSGPYTTTVEFPCDLENLEVWEAVVDNTTSNLPRTFNLLQDEVWMQEKNEIGFNFYTVYNESTGTYCDFDPRKIHITFDTGAAYPESTEEFDVPFEVLDWGGAGIINVNVSEIFRQPNQAADEFELRPPKPDKTRLAMQITRGPNCTSFQLNDCWNVDRVYNASVDTNGDGYFFVQSKDMWYTNDIGIVITYDEGGCFDRNDIRISLLSGGNLVTALQESYEIQSVSGTCAEDPFSDPSATIEDESLIFF